MEQSGAIEEGEINSTDEQQNQVETTNNDAFVVPPKPGTIEEEKQIIKQLEANSNNRGLKVGEIWYVIACKWWKQWKEYVNYDWYNTTTFGSSRVTPGPIDNSSILDDEENNYNDNNVEHKIKKSAMENYDYTIISNDMWNCIVTWYGGGPALPRNVIPSGWDGTNRIIEVRPLYLKIVKSSDLNTVVYGSFSKSDTIQNLKTTMCKKLNLNVDDVRVWDYHAFSKYKLLDNLESKLDQAQIIDGQPILLEEKDENGKFSETSTNTFNSGNRFSTTNNYSSSYSSSSSGSMYGYGSSSNSGPVDPGTVGLMNLGNTCFMNSSLQCLSNTAPLSEYLVTDKYKQDINLDNVLGTKGELVEEYASLIKQLWSGNHSAIAPRDFKWKLERFAPAFAGYQQHDAQELLSFLLDGLHEDLNRVKKKPYRERPETEQQGEVIFAQDLWNFHIERNDSIIVDWFQGQLKSTLVCPKCNGKSITFDPVMYLSLPLPIKSTRVIFVTFYFVNSNQTPTKYGIEVNKYGNVIDLKSELQKLTTIPSNLIRICDVYNNRFFKVYSDNDSLDTIQDRDFICAYQLLSSSNNITSTTTTTTITTTTTSTSNTVTTSETPSNKEEIVEEEMEDKSVLHINALLRKDEVNNSDNNSRNSFYQLGQHSRKTLFGQPFVISIVNPNELTYKKLYEIVYNYLSRYIKSSSPNNNNNNNNNSSNNNENNDVDAMQVNTNTNNEEYETDEDNDNNANKKHKKTPLFTIRIVDNYGMSDVGNYNLEEKEGKIDISERQTLGIIWTEDSYETYYDNTIEKQIEQHSSARKTNENNEENDSNVKLTTCLDLFTETEQLGPEDTWYCGKCKDHVQAFKKFDLWKLPPILVIHLKRFSYKKKYWREKLETFVDYPIDDLDLTDYIKGPQNVPPIYQLYAVSNHYGSLGGGHYTAYGKNRMDGKWYKYDDSHVSKIDEEKARTSSAYVLFYRRKDTLNSDTLSNNNNNNSDNTKPATTDVQMEDLQ